MPALAKALADTAFASCPAAPTAISSCSICGEEHHRRRSGKTARPRRDHGEQERHPVRPSKTDDRQRHPYRDPCDHHPRLKEKDMTKVAGWIHDAIAQRDTLWPSADP